jgi:hypothetical protein
LNTKIDTGGQDINVECLQPFAVYQTTQGTVDSSMGVYFRCTGEGQFLAVGGDTENIRWMSVQQIAARLNDDADQFCWMDRAGLVFYLRQTGQLE